jgi:helix-turn-helix protein
MMVSRLTDLVERQVQGSEVVDESEREKEGETGAEAEAAAATQTMVKDKEMGVVQGAGSRIAPALVIEGRTCQGPTGK